MTETVLASALLTEYNIHKNDRHYQNKKKTMDENKTKETDVMRRSRFTPLYKDIQYYYITRKSFSSHKNAIICITCSILETVIIFTTCRIPVVSVPRT